MGYKKRIEELRKILSFGLLEKDEAVSLSLLCLLSGKSIFFYGPPGSAKSLVARRVSCAFKSNKFFDYLMNRFSTPEEIFGPLKLSDLRKDKLVRNTEGFLPSADFAFLDEIWKSSPAILNALLTIINEKRYRNILASDKELNPQNLSQEELDKVPLKGLIAASNELPQKGQSLEALYDRFIMRLVVPRIESRANFKALLQMQGASDVVEVDDGLRFSNDELKEIKERAKTCKINKETIEVLLALKDNIQAYNDRIESKTNPLTQAQDKSGDSKDLIESKNLDSKNTNIESSTPIDISERRWIAIMELLKCAAVLSDKDSVDLGDLVLLKYCLWSETYHIKAIEEMIKDSMFDFDRESISYENKYDKLRDALDNTLNKQNNTMEIEGSINANNKKYIRVITDSQPFFCDTADINNTKKHKCYIYDYYGKNLTKTDLAHYEFDDTKEEVDVYFRGYRYDSIKYKKVTIKKLATQKLKDDFIKKYNSLSKKLNTRKEAINAYKNDFSKNNTNAFMDNKIFLKWLYEAESKCMEQELDMERLERDINGLKTLNDNMDISMIIQDNTTKINNIVDKIQSNDIEDIFTHNNINEKTINTALDSIKNMQRYNKEIQNHINTIIQSVQIAKSESYDISDFINMESFSDILRHIDSTCNDLLKTTNMINATLTKTTSYITQAHNQVMFIKNLQNETSKLETQTKNINEKLEHLNTLSNDIKDMLKQATI